jgi:hypothetical protein
LFDDGHVESTAGGKPISFPNEYVFKAEVDRDYSS